MNPIIDGQQPSWRLWGEEKVSGAIYTVYLKKVRYHPSSSVSFEDAEDSISHLEWETVRIRIIKAGNLERLVESLASDTGELESAYINIFLSTYRSFATTQQVLTLIIERYRQLDSDKFFDMPDELKEQHRKTLIQALMVWLDMHPEDFFDPPQFLVLHQIVEFANRYLPGHMLEIRAKHKLDRYYKEENCKNEKMFLSSSPETGWFPKHLECDGYDLLTAPAYEFKDIDERQFAEQLTWMDAELFKRLIPHHCLGSMWSRREKLKAWNGPNSTMDPHWACNMQCSSSSNTVSATVNQFNAVSARVISTVLSGLELEPLDRAMVITKWIDIAQELRFVKNFSSLKAITAALQSNAIYRLEKVWNTVPREKVEVFSELAKIFSEENNQLNCRNLLLKEGSAKFAEAVGEDDRQLQKLLQRQLSNPYGMIQGTVPYLGTFLTDLTMIDTAIPDILPDGLINFDKRRKEFEVLAQIQLLQSSAKNYFFDPDPRFHAWFATVNLLDDNESYELSCLIEPPSLSKKPTLMHKSKSVENHLGHRKTNSTSSTSTTSSSSQFYDIPGSDNMSNASSSYQTPPNGVTDIKSCMMRMNLSLPSLATYAPPTPPVTPGSTENVASLTPQVPQFYIIRVSIEQSDKNAQQGLNVYKSIMLSDRDHTRTVIQNSMMKHGIGGSPEQFTLSQLLPNGEIEFPLSANVFYAINTSYELNFILRLHDSTSTSASKKNKSGVPLVRRFLSNTTTTPIT